MADNRDKKGSETKGKTGATLDFPRPLTTVDVVIFAIQADALHVLLVQRGAAEGEPFPHSWALPGGFVDIAEDRDLEACAARKLKQKTGVVSPYLEQLGRGLPSITARSWMPRCSACATRSSTPRCPPI
jgi:8-oxo-dGTP diphosphatase